MTREEVFNKHMDIIEGLVAHYGRMPLNGCNIEDLRQEALMGLWRATATFDPTKGSFKIYGKHWATAYVRRAVYRNASCVNIARGINNGVEYQLSIAFKDTSLDITPENSKTTLSENLMDYRPTPDELYDEKTEQYLLQSSVEKVLNRPHSKRTGPEYRRACLMSYINGDETCTSVSERFGVSHQAASLMGSKLVGMLVKELNNCLR